MGRLITQWKKVYKPKIYSFILASHDWTWPYVYIPNISVANSYYQTRMTFSVLDSETWWLLLNHMSTMHARRITSIQPKVFKLLKMFGSSILNTCPPTWRLKIRVHLVDKCVKCSNCTHLLHILSSKSMRKKQMIYKSLTFIIN